jgi:ABC-type thiamine transport system ATPase subunit
VLARKKPVALSREDLTRLEPDEPREIEALRHQVEQLRDETLRLRAHARSQEAQIARQAALLARQSAVERELDELRGSRSWRLTSPLREARRRLNR